MSTEAEFSREIDVRQAQGRAVTLSASPDECIALARRFEIVRVDRLEAEVRLTREADVVIAEGTLAADIVQSCAVSAEDLPVTVREPMTLRFVPASELNVFDEEIEIDAAECDEIPYSGTRIDLGEAIAQSLALAIDPFLTGPEAEAARMRLRDEGDSPFAVLKGMGSP
jgi:uncharacterized metal-binding protein YceD (DUF177 family)